MSEFNPSIVVIENIIKHPNADNLEIATILGNYPCIIRSGEYKIGDLASYLPVDSVLKDTEEFSQFFPQKMEKYLCEDGTTKFRPNGLKYPIGETPSDKRVVSAKKLRGIYSEGILLPAVPGMNVGDSVIEHFGLTKYEISEEENVETQKKKMSANAESPPKGFSVPYYDIPALRSYDFCLKEDEEIVITEKQEGAHAVYLHDGDRLWVSSRNFYKKKDEDDLWWSYAIRVNLEDRLKNYPHFSFRGEIYGQVKNFPYDTQVVNGCRESNVRFFDIYHVLEKRYLDYDDFVRICDEIGLERAPELYRGFWKADRSLYSLADGNSTFGNHIKEGIVVKTTKERWEPMMKDRMQIKLQGQDYKLYKAKKLSK